MSGPKRMQAPEQWREALASHLRWRTAAGQSQNTINTREHHIRHFAQWVGCPPEEVTTERVADYSARKLKPDNLDECSFIALSSLAVQPHGKHADCRLCISRVNGDLSPCNACGAQRQRPRPNHRAERRGIRYQANGKRDMTVADTPEALRAATFLALHLATMQGDLSLPFSNSAKAFAECHHNHCTGHARPPTCFGPVLAFSNVTEPSHCIIGNNGRRTDGEQFEVGHGSGYMQHRTGR